MQKNPLKKHIPNLITLLNLTSGALAAVAAVEGRLSDVVWFVLASAVFDFADGLVARALRVRSDVGKELDSLADVVSFGLVPGLVVWQLLKTNPEIPYNWLAYAGLLLPAFAAYRLAKFNLDTRQTDSFLGVPTPAMSLFFVTLPLSLHQPDASSAVTVATLFIATHWIPLTISTLAFSMLMISEMPLLALKFKNLKWRENKLRYFLIAGSTAIVAVNGFAGLPLVVVWYLVLSGTGNWIIKSRG